MSEREGELERWIGATVGGKYRIERLLGRGGMGAVFAAQNTAIGKRVALKFLSVDAARDRDAARRFQREAQAASLIESEHIVQVFDAGASDDGVPFLVMEELKGEDLRSKFARERTLEPDVASAIASQVLRALVRAHAAGIVHRDLKPDNVFLCRRDDGSLLVKLVDFGISKLDRGTLSERLTRRGTVLGSAYYMSPEQAQASDAVDQRADLYSVGAILFEMLTGRPPHTGPTLESVLVQICTQAAPSVTSLRPDTPPVLARSIARSLEREPDARFANAAEMLAALGEKSAPGARVAATATNERRARSRTLVVGTLAALGGFALTAVFIAARPERATPNADAATTIARATAAPTPGPLVTPVLDAPLASAGPPGRVTATASVAAAAPAGSAAPPNKPKKSAPARKPSEAAAARPESGIASSLHLSTREP